MVPLAGIIKLSDQELPHELVEGFQRLASGDFSYRIPRSLARDESDTLIFFFNALAEETEQIIREVKTNENRLNKAIDVISAALMQVAAGNLEVHIERDYKGDQIDVLSYLVDTTISELRVIIAKNEQRNAEIQTRLEAQVKERTRELELLATMDPLTNVYNRRHFFRLAERLFAESERYKHPFSVIMIDADHFKNINDTYGHAKGDEALEQMMRATQTQIRSVDILGRYGGEEFTLALPQTNLDNALQVAKRISVSIKSIQFKYKRQTFNVTISIGVAERNLSKKETFAQVLNKADQALYKAKESGRNKVLAYTQ